jgi:hypothetical protein
MPLVAKVMDLGPTRAEEVGATAVAEDKRKYRYGWKNKKGKQQESILRPTPKNVAVYPLHQISICDYNGRYRDFTNLGMADVILSHNGVLCH